jgi:hypothetical protein
MTNREKMLGLAVLLLGVLFGAGYFWGEYTNGLDERRSALTTAETELRDTELKLAQGRRAMDELAAWQETSLPTNRDVALSLYRSWLLERAREAGLSVDDINVNQRTTVSTAFRSIGYFLEARGDLAAVTAFLHAFYSSDKLHQITRLNLRSTAFSPTLEMSLQVEALMLSGATHTDSLPEGETERLKLASLDDYKKRIGERNIFAIYTPPRPPGRPPVARVAPPAFDHAKHARVTAILESDARPQVWISVHTTGEVLRLFKGDTLKVGELEAEIKSISTEPRSVVLQTADGKELRVSLGHYLLEEGAAEPGDS